MTGFQSVVNVTPAPAVSGDFASANPRMAVLAGPGGLVAGINGVIVGNFAWVGSDGKTAQSFGTAPKAPDGFVQRALQATITNILTQQASMTILGGNPVTLFNEGDFWALNTGPGACAINDAVYATYGTGAITTGSAATGASATGSIGGSITASAGASFTGDGSGTTLTISAITGKVHVGDILAGTGIPANTTITALGTSTGGSGTVITSVATTASSASCTSVSTVLDVTAIGSGSLQPTDVISGTGVTASTSITAQLTGSAGSTGTYSMSGVAQSFASTTVTSLSTVLKVTAVGSGVLAVGDPISGTNVTANSIITGLLTGSGGTGNYTVSPASTAASTTITVTAGVLTNFKCKSAATVGELVKISTWG